MPEERREPAPASIPAPYLLGGVGVEGAVAAEVLAVGEADGRLHVGEVEEAVGQLDVESQAAAPAGRHHGPAQAMGRDLEAHQTSHNQESPSRDGAHSPVIDKEVVLVTPKDLPDIGVLRLRLEDRDARGGLALQLPEHGAGEWCLLIDNHVVDIDRALPGQLVPQAPEAAGMEAMGWGCQGGGLRCCPPVQQGWVWGRGAGLTCGPAAGRSVSWPSAGPPPSPAPKPLPWGSSH